MNIKLTSGDAFGKHFSNHFCPLNCSMNDGNGVFGLGGGVGSRGGVGVLKGKMVIEK